MALNDYEFSVRETEPKRAEMLNRLKNEIGELTKDTIINTNEDTPDTQFNDDKALSAALAFSKFPTKEKLNNEYYNKPAVDNLINQILADKLPELKALFMDELNKHRHADPIDHPDIPGSKIIDHSITRDKLAFQISFENAWPIGSIYMTTVDTNPATLFGFGTWTKLPAGKVLLSEGNDMGTIYTNGETGGSKEISIDKSFVPYHTHTMQEGSGAHTHTGKVSNNGDHFHGFQGEHWESYARFGTYNNSERGYGSAGGIDNDNLVYKTTTDGAHTHTLQIDPSTGSHTHTINPAGTQTQDVVEKHSIIQPYIICYMWKRTA